MIAQLCLKQCLVLMTKAQPQLIKKESYSKNLKDNIKGLKIGIPKEYRVDNMPKEIDELWEKGKKNIKRFRCSVN